MPETTLEKLGEWMRANGRRNRTVTLRFYDQYKQPIEQSQAEKQLFQDRLEISRTLRSLRLRANITDSLFQFATVGHRQGDSIIERHYALYRFHNIKVSKWSYWLWRLFSSHKTPAAH